jgi:MYXO-CTERM domain-containing protein
MIRFLSFVLALAVGAPAFAAAPERLGAELPVGDAPGATTVLPGDRVIATLVGESARSIAWRDAADYTEEPAIESTRVEARALLGTGTAETPVLLAAGDGVETFAFDTTTVPATVTVASRIPLEGASEGSLAAIVWSSELDVAFAVDDATPRVHSFNLAEGTAGTPVELDFTPTGLALVESSLLLVIGSDGAPRLAGVAVDTDGTLGEIEDIDLTGLVDERVDAIVSDGLGAAWLIASNGGYRQLVEAVRTDTEDDDERSATRDRARTRGCSFVDGETSGFAFFTLSCELPEAAKALHFAVNTSVTGTEVDFVYIGGAAVLQRVDVGLLSDLALESLPVTLTGASGDLAASSAADGFLYAAEPDAGLLAVVAPGPWLEITTDDTTLSGDDDVLTFSLTAHLESLETCDYTVYQGGDFTGTGTALAGGTGTATDATDTPVSIDGTALTEGSNRLFLVCTDIDGASGRASMTYFKGAVTAPEITAIPGDSRVVVSFEGLDDATIDHYVLYFDEWNFGATGTAAGTNSTGTLESPITIDASTGSAGDDDDSADEGDGARDDTTGLVFSYEITELVNDVSYYFAVSAVDENGSEGPRSAVVEARPGVTGGAAALAGDTYGCTCQNADTGRGTPVGLAALLALVGLVGRRRPGTAQDTTRS